MKSFKDDYISNQVEEIPLNFTQSQVAWECPSNIALVKYWGKREGQIPMNPSVSFTLKNSVTRTKIHFSKTKAGKVDFYFNGIKHPQFEDRIANYIKGILNYMPFLKKLKLEIHSENSFPHSSGIASSASGFGALALNLCSIEKQIFGVPANDKDFFRKASFLARLGSGSACRSIYPQLALWGKEASNSYSSDEMAIPVADLIHPKFTSIKDFILLIDKDKKSVSSTAGHQLMNKHPYAEVRFNEARKNVTKLFEIMRSGDFNSFSKLVEHEALSLHAMMMTSNPAFILLKANTIIVINKIWEFRKITGAMLTFTIDAGANLHLLFPESDQDVVASFIESDLKIFCQDGTYLKDEIGPGPVELTNND